MKTLKLNNLMRNLTLIVAGAFMATLVVIPFTTSANDDDEDDQRIERTATPPTYSLRATNGTNGTFALVEIDGVVVLALLADTPRVFADDDDDDD